MKISPLVHVEMDNTFNSMGQLTKTYYKLVDENWNKIMECTVEDPKRAGAKSRSKELPKVLTSDIRNSVYMLTAELKKMVYPSTSFYNLDCNDRVRYFLEGDDEPMIEVCRGEDPTLCEINPKTKFSEYYYRDADTKTLCTTRHILREMANQTIVVCIVNKMTVGAVESHTCDLIIERRADEKIFGYMDTNIDVKSLSPDHDFYYIFSNFFDENYHLLDNPNDKIIVKNITRIIKEHEFEKKTCLPTRIYL